MVQVVRSDIKAGGKVGVESKCKEITSGSLF